jgi:hypothetical protein
VNRPPDLSYEALAAATGTDWNTGRGELNSALASIREQMPGETDENLAAEIDARARLYRIVFPGAALTPPALAKHWRRVLEETTRKTQATNLSTPITDCDTCGGHRFVVVGTRKVEQTFWMRQYGHKPREDAVIEEYAPCPDCSTVDASYRSISGRVMPPDPERVRELMRR